MVSIIVALTIFFIFFIFHVVIFRASVDKNIDIKKITFLLFFLGLLMYIAYHALYTFQSYLYYSGMLLFISLALLHYIFFLNPYLKDRSPSSEILRFLIKKHSLSRFEIISKFDNSTLINKRINDLLKSGYILKVKEVYYPTKRGAILSTLITRYTRFMKWEKGG